MQRVFRGSAKVQRVFFWETGNANGLSGNAKGLLARFRSRILKMKFLTSNLGYYGSEVEFESLKQFQDIWIKANIKFKSMGLDTGHEMVLFGSRFSFVGQLGTWIFLYREM
ncbi:unnamed protein product [Rhizophagus irregularis]|nr:unnamed protein product [Rhizophagus irregularis]